MYKFKKKPLIFAEVDFELIEKHSNYGLNYLIFFDYSFREKSNYKQFVRIATAGRDLISIYNKHNNGYIH